MTEKMGMGFGPFPFFVMIEEAYAANKEKKDDAEGDDL